MRHPGFWSAGDLFLVRGAMRAVEFKVVECDPSPYCIVRAGPPHRPAHIAPVLNLALARARPAGEGVAGNDPRRSRRTR